MTGFANTDDFPQQTLDKSFAENSYLENQETVCHILGLVQKLTSGSLDMPFPLTQIRIQIQYLNTTLCIAFSQVL